MNNQDGINSGLRAHPDIFVRRDGDLDENDNVDNDARTRNRSNSGSIFESLSSIETGQRPQMVLSQSYGGDRNSSFLFGERGLIPPDGLGSRRSQSCPVPGMSSISYSGYLYKRSNNPHWTVGESQDRHEHNMEYLDPVGVPEIPSMPGIFPDSAGIYAGGSSLGPQQTPLDVPFHAYDSNNYNSTNVATNSAATNNNISTQLQESAPRPINTHQQSTLSHIYPLPKERKKTAGINLFELGAAFFGIDLGNNGNDDDDGSGGIGTDRLEVAPISSIDAKISEETNFLGGGEETQSRVSSTTVPPKNSSTNNLPGAARSESRPIPTIPSRASVPRIQSEPTGEAAIPKDFVDPEDGHLWRAKYCVLDDGILYFYRHAVDGNSAEAAAERKKNRRSMQMNDNDRDNYNNDDPFSQSYNDSIANGLGMGGYSRNGSLLISPLDHNQTTFVSGLSSGVVINSRRRSSAQDLSKSPMVRPGLHPLATNGLLSSEMEACMWEKRVFMDSVGGVRTAEQQYGQNSFELLAGSDGDTDKDILDTLILKGQNSTEMKEWIFQFHRSLASIMRNFIDSVGSNTSSGSFLDTHHRSSMNSSSYSRSYKGLRSIPQSSSEKQLQRLISTSPSLQHTLSHGHGRTSLKRRMGMKRTPSDSASLSSTPETSDIDFAFREPSPNNFAFSPLSSSPPVRVLLPPAVSSQDRGQLESTATATTRTITPTMESSPRDSEIIEPKPRASSGKYIPPHLRNKKKYVPPALRRLQQQHQLQELSQDSNDAESAVQNKDETQGGSLADLAERSGFLPINPPPEQTVKLEMPDVLDIVHASTTGFVRGGCADPQLIQGSILDMEFIPKKASRLGKTASEAYGSYGGGFADDTRESKSCLRWEIGAMSRCGARESNEDAYLITNDLLNAFDPDLYGCPSQTEWKEETTDHSVGLFCIFDGHEGNHGARFAVEQLGRFIHDELTLLSNIGETSDSSNSDNNNNDASTLSPLQMESVLREALRKMDVAFCKLCHEEGREWESGATALVAMLANENLVIASLGDCRGFLCRAVDDTESYVSHNGWEQLGLEIDQFPEGERGDIEHLQRCFWREMTTVHSPSAEIERVRIEKANGWITTETEIPYAVQLHRMDLEDADVIGIMQRCFRYSSDSERTMKEKECNSFPQRMIHISRVCGLLAVSRALGDRDFKADYNSLSTSSQSINNGEAHDLDGQDASSSHNDVSPWDAPLFFLCPDNHSQRFRGDLVTNVPDFHRIRLGRKEGASNEFLLLACDGLWDVMDADDAVRIARDLLFAKKWTAKRAAARLAQLAINLGSSDNVTVVLLRLFSRDDQANNDRDPQRGTIEDGIMPCGAC